MLVLSIFPGLGLFDRAFEAESYCVVRGPDPIWGGDVCEFTPPAGVFDGVIGGDPCQAHSTLTNLVRAKGLEPRFGDMTGEFQRIVEAARPLWFLRENVPRAPDVAPAGYGVHTFVLDNADIDRGDGYGQEQLRRRRFWFGLRDAEPVDLQRWIPRARERLPFALALCGDARQSFIPGGEAEVRALREGRIERVERSPDRNADLFRLQPPPARARDPLGSGLKPSVTGRHSSNGMGSAHPGNPPNYTLGDMLALQGLPRSYLDHVPFSTQGKRRAIGNGVPQAMGRALARAVREAAQGARTVAAVGGDPAPTGASAPVSVSPVAGSQPQLDFHIQRVGQLVERPELGTVEQRALASEQ